ncbi:LytTR family DNA-binding domain-containing protein [Leeuwenhoekiella marinoflava]|uniref:LytTR family transcriptional regulator n=2 Tax=Leeuwenhoekiella marinoflava TaxID=988 RepID=A0A4V1KS16_9FLAO|nr:LytTR family DNA-binding domain-containing protein [Leeuwenhoekiella marinoflava]RXG26899.1 LytTR family transcriptional regulator [Leeuwenhoekiella marinoflava]SHF40609.1 transcriptional regulator, LytTR family [Leeuwenhoekiella marinoflava DSM 3653]
MKGKYPFDPVLKRHFIIALGLFLWIFLFLFFTEPLDVGELQFKEKLVFLPIYSLVASAGYLVLLPLQSWLYAYHAKSWKLSSELLMLLAFSLLGLVLVRMVYLFVVIPYEPNPYSLSYFITAIYIPALLVVLPIIAAGRYGLGRYLEKRKEAQKITIAGSGNYEGFRLVWNQLIMITSADNYVEVIYTEDNRVKKHLIRNTLSAVASDLPQLLRVHRSFLINPDQYKYVNSENGKFKITMIHDLQCSVSNTYLPEVKAALNFTTN